jgi:outer membrane scaffolding protein for murein synthesis (MipA/OmpV family)
MTQLLKWPILLIALILTSLGGAHGDNATPAPVDDPPPLWELGVMAAAARLPHYIGSDEYENYLYPLPYVIYRGEFLRADRDGVRGIFYRGERFETSLSFWGNPPVPDDNEARQGMPELDAIGEAGPALRYYFYRREWKDHLYLQAAWRAALSFDFDSGVDADYQGWNGGLHLSYQNKSAFENRKLSLYFKAGLNFADSLYHDYFYGVPSQFATPTRNTFQADGGYSGLSVSASLYKELTPAFSLGFYARWNNLNGAVFEDSPLVRDKNTYAVGCLIVWKLAKSSKPAR